MKPGLFSFIGDEFENLFRYSDLFLPGISRISGIYFSLTGKQVRILSRSKNEEVEHQYDDVLEKRENIILIQKLRSENQPFAWINKGALLFDLPESKPKIAAPDLFSELENIILILRFKNDHDKLSDLLLVYFNKNLGNFGLSKSDKVLSTENKVIIGHILYYQFKSVLQINRANRELLQKLNHGVRSVIRENMSLRDALQQVQSSYGENLAEIAIQHLAKLSREHEKNYVLATESLDKIRQFKGNLKHLPQILENAVVFTENLLLAGDMDDIKIQPYSLDFDSYQVDEKSETSTRKIDGRESKAMQLLDKLERAARTLKGRNLPIISSRVGQEMEPPVSAPAITDALRKNNNFVRLLLAKYPEKWEAIRHDFKPLLNQLNKSDADEMREESA